MKNPKITTFFQLKEKVIKDLCVGDETLDIDTMLDLTDIVLDYLYQLPATDKRLNATTTVTEEIDNPQLWYNGYNQYVKPLIKQ